MISTEKQRLKVQNKNTAEESFTARASVGAPSSQGTSKVKESSQDNVETNTVAPEQDRLKSDKTVVPESSPVKSVKGKRSQSISQISQLTSPDPSINSIGVQQVLTDTPSNQGDDAARQVTIYERPRFDENDFMLKE
jgi:hypothetical protein